MVSQTLFKAYDIRGIVGQTLTDDAAYLIGRAIGTTARRKGLQALAVGRDGRLSSPSLSNLLAKGLRSTGADVVDVGAVPTPVLSYAIARLDADGGVMVTGSHNPKDYNGFKITLGGEALYGESILELAHLVEQGDFVSGDGAYRQTEIVRAYIDEIAQRIRLSRPLTIAVDCGNGIAGSVAPELYRALGCQVIELFSTVDGNFPNHHPDPAKPENLTDLIGAVLANKTNLGLAFDGDGDRLGVIAPTGEIIFPDRQMMLFSGDVLAALPGSSIIFDVKSTRNLGKWIEAKGGHPVIWRTGHSYLRSKMREMNAPLAGEMSGHLFFSDRWYGFDDGLYAGARLLEILSASDDIVGEFERIPSTCSTPEIQIPMMEGEPAKLVARVVEKADHFNDADAVILIDGLRADYPDGFGLVRSSNTSPVLVLRFEGQTGDALSRIQQKFKMLLKSLVADLPLPF